MEGNGLPGGYHCPPGFRFHPTDQELILHYLTKMVTGTLPLASSIIAEIDLYKSNPWDLPCKALFGDEEWFFFSPRDRKYPNGARPNRAAGIGYWKATGTDKPILGGTQCIGVKKALVFYKGRPPKGIKTDWVMHEYRLLDTTTSWSQKHRGTMKLDDWVLCRVRQKGSMGLQGEEKHESSNISHAFIAQHAEIPAPVNDKDTESRWSDYQLLAYLMGSAEKVGDAACSNSECAELGQAQFEDPTDFYSKRTLPFGPLDEILLMPPRKRLNCSGKVGEESSPSDSSIDLVYLD